MDFMEANYKRGMNPNSRNGFKKDMIPHNKGLHTVRHIRDYRKVLENKVGRKLRPNEVAHHINGNKLDDRPENLEVRDKLKHQKEHKRNQQFINEKLTKEDKEYIVKHIEINYKVLAKRFNICKTYIYEIRRKHKQGRLKYQGVD